MMDIGRSSVRVRLAVGGCHVLGHGHVKRPRSRRGKCVAGRQTVHVAIASATEGVEEKLWDDHGPPWESRQTEKGRGCEY